MTKRSLENRLFLFAASHNQVEETCRVVLGKRLIRFSFMFFAIALLRNLFLMLLKMYVLTSLCLLEHLSLTLLILSSFMKNLMMFLFDHG